MALELNLGHECQASIPPTEPRTWPQGHHLVPTNLVTLENPFPFDESLINKYLIDGWMDRWTNLPASCVVLTKLLNSLPESPLYKRGPYSGIIWKTERENTCTRPPEVKRKETHPVLPFCSQGQRKVPSLWTGINVYASPQPPRDKLFVWLIINCRRPGWAMNSAVET